MRWTEFESNYYEWDKDTLINNISKLENYGTAAEVAEIASCIQYEVISEMLVRNAMKAGVRFSPADIYEMFGAIDEELAKTLVQEAIKRREKISYEDIVNLSDTIGEECAGAVLKYAINNGFTPDQNQIKELVFCVDEDTITEVIRASNLHFSKEILEELDGFVDYDLLLEIDRKQGTQVFWENQEDEEDAEEDEETFETEECDDAENSDDFDVAHMFDWLNILDDIDIDNVQKTLEEIQTAKEESEQTTDVEDNPASEPGKFKKSLFGLKKYRYLFVRFNKRGREYAYRTEDQSIKVNDIVMVPIANEPDKPAIVTKVIVCTEEDAPYPLEKTKMISGRAKAPNIRFHESHKPVRDELEWIDELEMLDAIFDDDD